MSDPKHLSKDSLVEAMRRREAVVERFVDAWQAGQTPSLDEHLAGQQCERQELLLELALVDLSCRIERGLPASVESYLTRFPELRNHPGLLLELIRREWHLRATDDPERQRSEYLCRFPEVADALKTLPAPPVRTPQTAGSSSGTRDTLHPSQPARAIPNWPSIPGYEIQGELGRGGMGIVFKARQVKLNRLVALKMIRDGVTADEEDLDRFRREALAVAALHHPNIVQIHEIGEASGRPFFALEFVEGGSLAQWLRGDRPSPAQSALLLETLARAMQHAHERGILHRDLKPANVLLMPVGGNALAMPRITDFGLAKSLDDAGARTQTGAVMGTPSYMAPEQARGLTKQIGPACDIYALGATLYECLTGKPPFTGKDPLEILQQVILDEPVPPSRLVDKVPRDLETICLACLEKDPARRYASAGELAEDLQRFRERQPIRARRAGSYERGVRWLKRRSVGVLAASLALLILVGGVSGYLFWQMAEKRRVETELKNRLEHEYFTAVAYRRGEPTGVGVLSEDEARSALRAFRVHRRGGVVERIDVLDRQMVRPAVESWTERVGLAPRSQVHRREAFYRFSHEQGRVVRQEACDPFGRPLWSLTWGSSREAVLLDHRTSQVGRAGERRIDLRLSWNEDGWLQRIRFVDQQGKSIILPDVGGGRDFTSDSRGLITRTNESGQGGIPLVRTRVLDEQGRCTSEALFDGQGRPALEHGVHRIVHRYLSASEVHSSAFDAGGRAVAAANTGVHRLVVNYLPSKRLREQSAFGPDQAPVVDRRTGVHREWSRETDQGTLEEQQFLAADGTPAWHRLHRCSRRTTSFDAQGNVVEMLSWVHVPPRAWAACRREDGAGRVLEVAEFSPTGQKMLSSEGYHRRRCRYDEKGHLAEESVFDVEDNPFAHKVTGAHRWTSRCDERGELVERAWFGADGKPIRTRDGGYHRVTFEYDAAGRRTQEDFHAPEGNRTLDVRGFSRVRTQYDQAGRVLDQAYWKLNRQGEPIFWLREDPAKRTLERASYSPEGEPVKTREGYHRATTRYDGRGNVIAEAYHGVAGEPVQTTWGYHRSVSRFDDKGRRLETGYFDVKGDPATKTEEGLFRMVWRYEAGMTTTDVLGPNGRLANNRSGWSRMEELLDPKGQMLERSAWRVDAGGTLHRLYRQDGRWRMLESANFSKEGIPELSKEGGHRTTTRYDSAGNRIDEAHFGLRGEPVVATSGYHRRVARYGGYSRLLEEAFLGSNGELVAAKSTIHSRILHRYDVQGRTVETMLLGPGARPVNGAEGWARLEQVYPDARSWSPARMRYKADPQGRLRLWKQEDTNYRVTEQAYFTPEGRPDNHKDGYHRIKTRHDREGNVLEVAYFGLDDELVPDRKNQQYRVLHRYDSKQNRLETLELGPDSRPRNGKEGHARDLKVLDAAGNMLEWWYWKADRAGKLWLWRRYNSKFQVVEQANASDDGNPGVWPEGHHRWTVRFDANGYQTEVAYFGLDGKPVLTTWGCHRWLARYDDKGRKFEQAYFGVHGEPALESTDKSFRALWQYDSDGNTTDILELGPNGRPMNNKHGWARRQDSYDRLGRRVERIQSRADPSGRLRVFKRFDHQDRLVEEGNLTSDGVPRAWPEGNYRWKVQFDSRGNKTGWAAFGENGEPVMTTYGYHRWVARFDEHNRKAEQVHLGTNGEPTYRADEGSFRFLWKHDAQGNLQEVLFLGPNGRPRNIDSGWARRVDEHLPSGKLAERKFWKANPAGELVMWKREDDQGRILAGALLTNDGIPTVGKDGYYRWTARFDSRGKSTDLAMFDLQGRPSTGTLGFHRARMRYDAHGRMLELAQFDVAGQLASHKSDGSYRALYRYDSRGNEIEMLSLGPNGRPRNMNSGWSRRQKVYDEAGRLQEQTLWIADPQGQLRLLKREDGQKRIVEAASFSPDGRPLLWKQGHHRRKVRYDTRGHAIEEKYFGLDGEPAQTSLGYHCYRARYDEQGRYLEWAVFDKMGNPALDATSGSFRILYRLDPSALTNELWVLGPNGRPALGKDGYHHKVERGDRVRQVESTRHFGVDGKPAHHVDGYHEQFVELDARLQPVRERYLDASGKLARTRWGYASRQFLYRDGVHVETTAADADGKSVELVAVVMKVEPDGPAARLGIRPGDFLRTYRGSSVPSVAAFIDRRKAEGKEGAGGDLEVVSAKTLRKMVVPGGILGIELHDMGIREAAQGK